MAIPGYDAPEKADKLIQDAKDLIAKYEAEGTPIPSAPVKEASAPKAHGDAKMQAESRLKAELAALDKPAEEAAPADTNTGDNQ